MPDFAGLSSPIYCKSAQNPATVIKFTTTLPPSHTDNIVGTIGINTTIPSAYIITNKNGSTATWLPLAGGADSFTSVTASGNITTTAGNFVASGAGSGLVLTPTVVAAGASPQVANGRVGQVTFSGVSIAGGATQTFVITNSAITGSGTVVGYWMYGATTGAALNIQSVTNSAGSSSIVVENGTGLTTSVANLVFAFMVLN